MVSAARREVVGRDRDLEVVAAALGAGRSVLLEGPPGTGKTTLLRSLTGAAGIPLVVVEGKAELTSGRLIGHHDPSRILADGYRRDNFVPGPLVDAMTEGGVLYVEELNRVPEESLNVLLGALSERRLHVPRFGDPAPLVTAAVAATRATRGHPDVRIGSSVRGAIDLVAVAVELGTLRHGAGWAARGTAWRSVGLDAALASLSGRITRREGSTRSAEEIVTAIWEAATATVEEEPDAGKAPGPIPLRARTTRQAEHHPRP